MAKSKQVDDNKKNRQDVPAEATAKPARRRAAKVAGDTVSGQPVVILEPAAIGEKAKIKSKTRSRPKDQTALAALAVPLPAEEEEPEGKRGIADPDAWEAAKKVAKALRKARKEEKGSGEWRKLPWKEIRAQLRRKGDYVDLDAVPPTWLSESPQIQDMRRILEEAGFVAEGNIYRWPRITSKKLTG
ncbi:MAG TPA: hypothetical protein VNN09_01640 [Candidatus Competibacteraceae bacterium]|nr:hypothetical protein [Candidatus Competibacteraceae bacterium]